MQLTFCQTIVGTAAAFRIIGCTAGIWMLPCGSATPAAAQDWGDPTATGRIQFGPLAATPVFTASGIGIDPNVFNASTDPKSDMTAVLEPAVNAWLRLGRNWVAMSSRVDGVYFKDYADQRTLSSVNDMRVDVPLNRIRVFFGAGYSHVRDRPGLDIDLRAQHTEYRQIGGMDVRLSAKTTLNVAADRSTVAFQQGTVVLGNDLATEMNRETQEVHVAFQQALTPLTTFVVNTSAQRNTFASASDRNNTIMQVTTGLAFKPLALLTGRVDVGMLRVVPAVNATPAFNGYAADVDLGYPLGTATRLAVRLARSVTYSFDQAASYSVETDQTLTVNHQLGDLWDLSAFATRSNLVPRFSGTLPLLTGAAVVYSYDAGIGWRVGERVHVGIHVNHSQRLANPGSVVSSFSSGRVYSSVTYGG